MYATVAPEIESWAVKAVSVAIFNDTWLDVPQLAHSKLTILLLTKR